MDHKVPESVEWLSRQYGVPGVDLKRLKIEERALLLVPAELAHKFTALAIALSDNYLIIAFADPSNVWAQDELATLTGKKIEPVVADERQLKDELRRRYGSA